MVAGIINICGAFGGRMSGPTGNNKKGMFENAKIRNILVKPYLEQHGYDRMGQYPLPKIDRLTIPVDWNKKVLQILESEGYRGSIKAPWMYKGAKCCLMWPVWHFAFPKAKWIIVRRRTGDIITSCLKTNFMRAFRRREIQKAVSAKCEEDGWLWWVHQHEERFREMIDEGLNCKIIWPERMVQGDYQQVMEMIDWLGLEWKSEVLSFVDPKLWKARRK
jgi:hypothetical protein